LNGFVGEFLILLGTFGVSPVHAAFAATGVILSAVYMLWMFQRVIWGEVSKPENESLMDINGRERMTLVPLVILIVWMGIYSNHFLRPMDTSVTNLLNRVENNQGVDVKTARQAPR
jgi:NADH-quinone oxidoreductase subunit M